MEAVTFILAFLFAPVAAIAGNGDTAIYRIVLSQILKHEAPPRFAIWDQKIPSTTILKARVPRHLPENQFAASLPGLPRELQRRLLVTRKGSVPASMVRFDISSGAFAGFVGQADYLQFAQTPGQSGRQDWVLAVGFSKVVYDDDEHNALVYAETCMTVPDGACGGEGFWFVRRKSGWQLERHAFLWQGTDPPFWTVGIKI